MLVRGIPLRVVGVYAAKGQSAYGQDQDDLVMIPFSTAERKVLASPRRAQRRRRIPSIRRRRIAMLDLTQQSYQAGQASLLQMLESQRLYQQARLGLARASGQRYTDTAQLFIAMGGAQP